MEKQNHTSKVLSEKGEEDEENIQELVCYLFILISVTINHDLNCNINKNTFTQ